MARVTGPLGVGNEPARHLAHGQHAPGGTAGKHLVGGVQVKAGELGLGARHPNAIGQLQYRGPGNTVQYAAGRGEYSWPFFTTKILLAAASAT